MIDVNHISKTYYTYQKTAGFLGSLSSILSRKKVEIAALQDVSLSIQSGEIIGENGAGKTTLIKILTGLLHPDKGGTLSVMNHIPYKKEKNYLKNISLVSGQKNQLQWDLSAMDAFRINKEIYKINDKEFETNITILSEMLKISDKINVPVRQLSLGQRMKLEIIYALLHNPKILYLDEPTIGLDFSTQHNVRTFLKEYNKKYNATIILTSHNIEDIKHLCNRLIILNKGKVTFDGQVEQLNAFDYSEKENFKTFEIVLEDVAAVELTELLDPFCNSVQMDKNIVKATVALKNIPNFTRIVFENMAVKDLLINDDVADSIKAAVISNS